VFARLRDHGFGAGAAIWASMTSRIAAAVILVLCSFVVIGFGSGIAVSVIRETRRDQQMQENPWRRTTRGWEDMRHWKPLAPATPAAQPHPVVLALWMLVAGVGSLYCCGREKMKSRG
jgi:hypothetical protein